MHVSVTVCFTDYAFNENIHNMYWFHKWDVLPDTPFFMSLSSLEKKKTFACVIFGKIIMLPARSIALACTIDRMPACLSPISH